MGLTKVAFKPGIHKDLTQLSSEGSFYDCEKVRFRDGLPENIGGWRKLLETGVTGIPREVHTWANNAGSKITAIGTSKKLYLFYGNQFFDITPLDDSGTLGNNPFTTNAAGSAVVTVSDTAHGRAAGDYIHFTGTTGPIDGIPASEFNTELTVTSVIDNDTYTITLTTTATAGSVSGGGSGVDYEYEIGIGKDSTSYGYGYGAGTYNLGTWGTPRSSSNVTLDLRVWSLDNWGEDLLCMPRGGNLYVWDATNGPETRATLVSNAPTGEFFLVDPNNREVIVFGEDGDPVGIKWCDQNDYTNWTASATTTADERRLLKGAKIVGALLTKGEILIWTDVSLHGMQFTYSGDFVYALRDIGQNCGLLGINAAAVHGATAWWMGNNKNFYVYDGRVRVLQSPLRREVFDNLDFEQKDKVYAGLNSAHTEIWFFWQSTAGSENDRYTIFNYGEAVWYHGTLERTAWADKDVYDYPLALNSSGYLFEHEYGYNDDGSALESWVESGDFDLGDGDVIMFMNGVIPDFTITGTGLLTLKARKYPNTEQITKGPIDVTSSTKYVKPRLRGRQCAVRFGSNEVDAQWRFGSLRFDIRPDGGN